MVKDESISFILFIFFIALLVFVFVGSQTTDMLGGFAGDAVSITAHTVRVCNNNTLNLNTKLGSHSTSSADCFELTTDNASLIQEVQNKFIEIPQERISAWNWIPKSMAVALFIATIIIACAIAYSITKNK